MHPKAVAAAGLDYDHVVQLARKQGGQLFEHPTYGPLLLHWGANAHGYTAFPVPEPEPVPHAIIFTPYTHWRFGYTYYQLASALPCDHPLNALVNQATSRLHQPQGVPGGQSGFYFTDLAEVEKIVESVGGLLVLHQRQSLYTVTVETAPNDCSHRWVFPVAEAARGWYSQLTGPQKIGSRLPHDYYPRLSWNQEAYVGGYPISTGIDCNEVCGLSSTQFAHLPTDVTVVEPWSVGPMYTQHLTDTDQPLEAHLPTLMQDIHQLTASGIDVAARLGLSANALRRRVLRPGNWRLQELEYLAQLTRKSVSALVDIIQHEGSNINLV
ncbi:hypothetical protein MUN82_09955 [Hymenobacter aerilatus]|uniref:Uncharacterized protein n=1 Tax=Hymenobacter aerilatus TaxID=2932251 RepID=A0A8T9SYS4_9BACT|nr:hypothetical protein [Hymenobacter aerilatus]UOR07402.1 hypothetical protein MUN82_09955 [Hymenobacter aerilatus]